jgi:S-disulfanyl-L-cysteine oxidoreductase SoxD
MRSAPATLALAGLLTACAAPPSTTGDASLPTPRLGQPAPASLLAAWDTSVMPDGTGLPAGSGTAREGAPVYLQKCAACHGESGAGKPADPLVGGMGTLKSKVPVRTIGSYWPYATTLFDYTRRAMPLNNPMSLTADEVYAVSAYLLHLNGIVADDERLDARTLAKVRMPNRDGFISDWPPRR